MNHKHIRKANKKRDKHATRAAWFFRYVLEHPNTIENFLNNDGDGVLIIYHHGKYDFRQVRNISMTDQGFPFEAEYWTNTLVTIPICTFEKYECYSDGSRIVFDEKFFK